MSHHCGIEVCVPGRVNAWTGDGFVLGWPGICGQCRAAKVARAASVEDGRGDDCTDAVDDEAVGVPYTRPTCPVDVEQAGVVFVL